MLYVIAVLIILFLFYIIIQKIELCRFTTTLYRLSMSNNNIVGTHKTVVSFIVISDLHNHVYGKKNKRLLSAIYEAEPSFIIIAGDMMIAKPGYSLDIVFDFLDKLSSKYTVYYGMGNHEYRLKLYREKYPGMYESFYNFLMAHNIKLLDNKSETININGEKIVITGLEIEREYYKRFNKIYMDKEYINSLVGKKTNEYTILIAHNPEYFDTYVDWGADLILSGHIHGGMVRLPFFGGLISPKVQFFPKYDCGLFEKDGKQMILSRGLGMHTLPIRINNRAELIKVDLLKEG